MLYSAGRQRVDARCLPSWLMLVVCESSVVPEGCGRAHDCLTLYAIVKVCVARRGLCLSMPKHLADRRQIGAGANEQACEGMPQIVDAERLNSCGCTRCCEGAANLTLNATHARAGEQVRARLPCLHCGEDSQSIT